MRVILLVLAVLASSCSSSEGASVFEFRYESMVSRTEDARNRVAPSTKEEVRDHLVATGLSSDRIDQIVDLAEPAVFLEARGIGIELDPGGLTQIGGLPMLPEDFAWPTDPDGNKLSLVAQIDLDALPDDATRLPDNGLLQFYLPLHPDFYGYEVDMPGTVLWFDSTADLVLRDDGHAAWGREAMQFDFRSYYSVPTRWSETLSDWSDAELEQYDTYPHPYSNCLNVVGGWPQGFVDDPRSRANDMHLKTSTGESTVPADWVSLIELRDTPSDDGFEGMWGDGSSVKWLIREQDLADQTFDTTWYIFS